MFTPKTPSGSLLYDVIIISNSLSLWTQCVKHSIDARPVKAQCSSSTCMLASEDVPQHMALLLLPTQRGEAAHFLQSSSMGNSGPGHEPRGVCFHIVYQGIRRKECDPLRSGRHVSVPISDSTGSCGYFTVQSLQEKNGEKITGKLCHFFLWI